MNRVILADGQLKPSLFLWNGPIERRQIEAWIGRHDWAVPEDLVDLWTRTGGGEIYEGENFLPPLVSRIGEDEVDLVTGWCRARGMAAGLVVFHQGLGYTAVRSSDGAYISLDGNLKSYGEYPSLDQWYVSVLRDEYAQRYGLPPVG